MKFNKLSLLILAIFLIDHELKAGIPLEARVNQIGRNEFIEIPLDSIKLNDYHVPLSIAFDKANPDKCGVTGLNCFISIFDSRIEKLSETTALWYTPFGASRVIEIGKGALPSNRNGELEIPFDDHLRFVYYKGRLAKILVKHAEKGQDDLFIIDGSLDGSVRRIINKGCDIVVLKRNAANGSFSISANENNWVVSSALNDVDVVNGLIKVESIKSNDDELRLRWQSNGLNVVSSAFPGARDGFFSTGLSPKGSSLSQVYTTEWGTKIDQSFFQTSPGVYRIRKLIIAPAGEAKREYSYFYDAGAKLIKTYKSE